MPVQLGYQCSSCSKPSCSGQHCWCSQWLVCMFVMQELHFALRAFSCSVCTADKQKQPTSACLPPCHILVVLLHHRQKWSHSFKHFTHHFKQQQLQQQRSQFMSSLPADWHEEAGPCQCACSCCLAGGTLPWRPPGCSPGLVAKEACPG